MEEKEGLRLAVLGMVGMVEVEGETGKARSLNVTYGICNNSSLMFLLFCFSENVSIGHQSSFAFVSASIS